MKDNTNEVAMLHIVQLWCFKIHIW